MNTVVYLTVTDTYLYRWYQEGVRSLTEFNRRISQNPSLFGGETLKIGAIGFGIIQMMRHRGITPPHELDLVQ